MNIEELREYCLAKMATTEEMPFDDSTLVFKVAGKIFLFTDLETAFAITIKNSPENIILQRENYASVSPGFHVSKVHWNTVLIDGSIEDQLLYKWIDQSYESVVKKMPKKIRDTLLL